MSILEKVLPNVIKSNSVKMFFVEGVLTRKFGKVSAGNRLLETVASVVMGQGTDSEYV